MKFAGLHANCILYISFGILSPRLNEKHGVNINKTNQFNIKKCHP